MTYANPMNTEACVHPGTVADDAVPGGLVNVQGPLTVAAVEHWRGRFAAELERVGVLKIDLGDVTAIDVFGLQLLHAVERTAGLTGRGFRALNTPGHVAAVRAAAGFARAKVTLAEEAP